MLKLYFVKAVNDSTLREIIEQRRDLRAKKRVHFSARKAVIFPTEKEKHKNYGHYLTLSCVINREIEYRD